MEHSLDKIHQGMLVEEEEDLNLIALCNYCRVSADLIIELVNEGVLDPQGKSKGTWRFTFTTIERVKKANRLLHDFELNLPGVAIALHLLDRIEQLESMLEVMKK